MVPPQRQGLTRGLSVLNSSSPKHILHICGVLGLLVCSFYAFSGMPLGLISMCDVVVPGNLPLFSKFRVLSLSCLKVGSHPSVWVASRLVPSFLPGLWILLILYATLPNFTTSPCFNGYRLGCLASTRVGLN